MNSFIVVTTANQFDGRNLNNFRRVAILYKVTAGTTATISAPVGDLGQVAFVDCNTDIAGGAASTTAKVIDPDSLKLTNVPGAGGGA